ncbi:hypothetical protein LF887_20475 [Chryseobacterium sp. MEBOG06]|uniref:hypothetical protein n=1 Tax=Chryseobacterium sp. MEBOG06 TaxID=2879938 RepID=UPI001F418A1E|nr:hypothetical protein [Chryseobacterium sp. MEBOG06]UKB83362.1 hypothetical protein LF887_20475 [Chryseobacterium sp. MEBOG06]
MVFGSDQFSKKIKDNKEIRWDGVFYRIFEYETLLDFQNGNLIKQQIAHNYQKIPKGINRIDKTKISDILFKQLKKQKWENDCSGKYLITIGKDGKISNVRMPYSEKEIDEYFEKEEYNYCIQKIKSALSNLQFDIIKDKGKPIAEDIYLEIWQDKNSSLENWTH